MSETRLNIRIDENLKTEADQIFKEMGMSLTTAVTVFLKQSVRKRFSKYTKSVDHINPVAFGYCYVE